MLLRSILILLISLSQLDASAQVVHSQAVLDSIKNTPLFSNEMKAKMIALRYNACITDRLPLSTIIAKKEYQDGTLLFMRRDLPDAQGRVIEGTVFLKGAFHSAIAGDVGSKRCDPIKEADKNK